MRVIRKGIFETNSSTTHSCVIMTEDQHEEWEEGLYYYNPSKWYDPFKNLPEEEKPVAHELYTQEEVLEFLAKIGDVYNPDEYYSADDFIYEEAYWFVCYDRWKNDEYLEYDSTEYKTQGGENIIIECKFGRDG